MKIANWVEQADGSFAWVTGDRKLASVYALDGVWRTKWFGEPGQNESWLFAEFPSAHDACLAAEKFWPPRDRYFGGWLESKNGGYFRKLNDKRTAYVRKADNGWYAVQTDGKVLGTGGTVSWFKTAMDACAAVEKELYTPVDADPFVNARGQWRWFKLRNTRRVA